MPPRTDLFGIRVVLLAWICPHVGDWLEGGGVSADESVVGGLGIAVGIDLYI